MLADLFDVVNVNVFHANNQDYINKPSSGPWRSEVGRVYGAFANFPAPEKVKVAIFDPSKIINDFTFGIRKVAPAVTFFGSKSYPLSKTCIFLAGVCPSFLVM